MLKNKGKKVYIAISLCVLLLAALGMVVATGWDSSKASHDTLYADEMRGKADNYITINDRLLVQTDAAASIVIDAITNQDNTRAISGQYLDLPIGFEGSYDMTDCNVPRAGGYLGSEEYGAYAWHCSDNYGYLASEDYGAYGEHSSGNKGYIGSAYYGVIGLHSSGKGGVLGTPLYGVYTTDELYAGQGITVPSGQTCSDDSSGPCSLNDIAEDFPAADDVEAGDVVVIDSENPESVVKSTKAYDTKVAGIISTSPAFHISMEDSDTPLALAGRVPTKVSAENGMIEIGDLLTTSNTPGHAMKCTDMQKCFGALVGKALEPLDKETGKIVVLVALG